LSKVAEDATKYFIDDQTNMLSVEGIIIAGSGNMKSELIDQEFLDKRIQEGILQVVDVASSGKNGLTQAIGDAGGIFESSELMKQRGAVSDLMTKLVQETSLVAIGKKEVWNALEMVGLVETLIIHKSFDKDSDSEEKNMVPREPQHSFEEFIGLAQNSNSEIQVISAECAETHQFLVGLGGIAAVLRYAVDLNVDENVEDEESE